jgi:hypothetical protein
VGHLAVSPAGGPAPHQPAPTGRDRLHAALDRRAEGAPVGHRHHLLPRRRLHDRHPRPHAELQLTAGPVGQGEGPRGGAPSSSRQDQPVASRTSTRGWPSSPAPQQDRDPGRGLPARQERARQQIVDDHRAVDHERDAVAARVERRLGDLPLEPELGRRELLVERRPGEQGGRGIPAQLPVAVDRGQQLLSGGGREPRLGAHPGRPRPVGRRRGGMRAAPPPRPGPAPGPRARRTSPPPGGRRARCRRRAPAPGPPSASGGPRTSRRSATGHTRSQGGVAPPRRPAGPPGARPPRGSGPPARLAIARWITASSSQGIDRRTRRGAGYSPRTTFSRIESAGPWNGVFPVSSAYSRIPRA